ncbi:MAG: zinc-binding dehydrogenase [Acidimicrobiia bacterium]
MQAASLNPADLAISRGLFHKGHPPLPYVVGLEGVGRITSGPGAGRMAFAYGGGLGVTRNGTAADRFVASTRSLIIELPDGADAGVGAALGTAGAAGWLPIIWRAGTGPDDVVLVLGATGTAGRIALQAARFAGAARIVAAGRDRSRLEAVSDLADATVWLEAENLSEVLLAACETAPTVIYDPLFGLPFEAALSVAAPRARIVQVGSSAGATATFSSSTVRGRQLNVLGYSNLGAPRDVFADAYRTMLGRFITGSLVLDVVAVPLDEIERAWAGVEDGSVKYVVVP